MKTDYLYNVTNILIRVCLPAILLVCMPSCDKEVTLEEELSPICLSGALEGVGQVGFTKAEITDSDGFTTGDKMGLLAYKTGTSHWEDAKSVTPPNLMYDQLVTKTATGWVYSPIRYWIPFHYYSFFAYAPYQTEIAELPGSTVAGTPYLDVTTPLNSDDHIDLKIARCIDRQDEGWPVNLPFKHAFARIRFSAKVTANEAYYQAKITGITLSGIYTTGRLSLETGIWDGQGASGTITVLDQDDPEDDLLAYYVNPTWENALGTIFLIPQTITGGMITIHYTIVSPFEENPILRQTTMPLIQVTYAANQALHYVLTIHLTGVAFTVQVEDWNVIVDPNNIALE